LFCTIKMEIYPYKAEEHMSEARTALARMRTFRTPSEAKEAFLSFLNASRFIFQAWNKDFKNVEGFDDWWQIKAKMLCEDPLCIFFRNLRNEVTKAGAEPFWINQTIQGPMTIEGPVQIGPQGIFKGSIENGRPKWNAIALSGVHTIIGFHSVPVGYENLNPFDLCEKYLNILNLVLDEFVITFNK
jgi:hypothetical protein